MKDEIKEILDEVNKIIDNTAYNEEYSYFKVSHISKLLDCILDYVKKNKELQEENQRLKELCNKYEEEHNTAFKLWTMKMEEMPDYEEKMVYKSRCEKAIEYVREEQQKIDEMGDDYCYLDEYEINELLNILNGGDKE